MRQADEANQKHHWECASNYWRTACSNWIRQIVGCLAVYECRYSPVLTVFAKFLPLVSALNIMCRGVVDEVP